MIPTIITFLSSNLWRTGAIALLLVGIVLLAVRSCDDDKVAKEAREHGATQERAINTGKVIEDVEKAKRADTVRDPARDERLSRKYCRDCAEDD